MIFAGDDEHLVGRVLDDLGPRVVVLVDAVAEAHQLALAGLHFFDIARNAVLRPDLVEHPQHFFIRPTMQRPGQRRRACRHA